MKHHLRFLILPAAACCLAFPAYSQQDISTVITHQLSDMQLKRWTVGGRVVDLQGDPVRTAMIQVEPLAGGGNIKTAQSDFQGNYRSEVYTDTRSVNSLAVLVTVSKKGYRKVHKLVVAEDSETPHAVNITLREVAEDASLLSQKDMISMLAPRLKTLNPADGLSAAGEKDYSRGVAEFMDRHHSDRALQYFTNVTQHDQSCVQCLTMLGLAELDSEDWDGARRDIGDAINKILADPKLGRPEPLIAYGVTESWKLQPKNAAGYFSEAVKLAPNDALALQELGRSQILQENWGPATQELGKALAAGAPPAARLLLVQSLLGESKPDEANEQLTKYLDGRDIKRMPLSVRELWAQVQNQKKVETAYIKPKPHGKKATDFLNDSLPELAGMAPATNQDQLKSILDDVSRNVQSFFQNLPNTVSLEMVHQEKLRQNGKKNGEQDQKFHYLCVLPSEPYGPGFNEYRANLAGDKGDLGGLKEGYMLTSNFASASLYFHPAYISDSKFRYRGRQKMDGHDTYVIAFAQVPTKAKLSGSFKSGNVSMPTFTQGLAWVDAGTYEIIRLKTDLLRPLPDVKLEKESTDIQYTEVHFKSIAEGFWVPSGVTVTVDWDNKILRNIHQYSEFKLFNVGSTNKIGNPKGVASSGNPPPKS